MTYRLILIILTLAIPSSVSGKEMSQQDHEELDIQIHTTIQHGCQVYHQDNLPKALAWAVDWLYVDSVFCRDLVSQGKDLDIGATIIRYQFKSNSEQWYLRWQAYNDKAEADIHEQMECRNEYMCMETRIMLKRLGIPVSQEDYERVAAYCRPQPGPYSCIEGWFEKDWIEQGNRTPPKREKVKLSAGLNIDDLMGGTEGQSVSRTTDNPYQPDTSFGHIYADRERIKVDKTKTRLVGKNNLIQQQCRCSDTNNGCFQAKSFKFENLNKTMAEVDGNYETQMTLVCDNWKENLQGRTANNAAVLTQYLAQGDTYLKNMDILTVNYKKVTKTLGKKQHEIEEQIQEQERKKKQRENNAFAAALGTLVVGAAVGNSLDIPLDSDALAQMSLSVSNSVAGGEDVGAALFKGTLGMSKMVASKSGNPAAQQNSNTASSNSSSSASSTPAEVWKYEKTFSPTCSSKIMPPIRYKSGKCLNAYKTYAQAFTCNEIHNMQSARQGYNACIQEEGM